MSAAELAAVEPRFDTHVTGLDFAAAQSNAARDPSASGGIQPGWDPSRGNELATGFGAGAVRDALREFVNVQPVEGRSASAGGGRRAQQEGLGLAGVDLGPAAQEWIRETVDGILNSALQLERNERGRTAFSVFGFGEFSVAVAGDGSGVALTTGDDVLLSAHRVGPSAQAAGYGGGANYPSGGFPGEASAPPGPLAESPFKQAMELAVELASHPLSLLVYCIVAVYVVVWTVLERQNRHGHARPAVHRTGPVASAVVNPRHSPQPMRPRSRTRIHKRTRA